LKREIEMPKIKLILADDHAVVRSGLRMLLEAQPDIDIIAEAETGTEAVSKTRSMKPDVVLMDIQMPGLNGIEATKQIKEKAPETAVLALTMYEDDQYFFEMLHAGASGYVPKRAAPDELLTAIRTVGRGEVFLYPSLASRLVQDYLKRVDTGDQPFQYDDLTPREREVLIVIAEGLSNAEIANRLVISIKTVDRHRENIMRKLNLHSRIELVKYALRIGLIDLED
jgi:two-component system response regulator NreC